MLTFLVVCSSFSCSITEICFDAKEVGRIVVKDMLSLNIYHELLLVERKNIATNITSHTRGRRSKKAGLE